MDKARRSGNSEVAANDVYQLEGISSFSIQVYHQEIFVCVGFRCNAETSARGASIRGYH